MEASPNRLAAWLRSTRPEQAAAAVAALAAIALTRHGLLLDLDSPTYLATARGYREDLGTFLSPPSGTSLSIRGLFPPAYPAVLAGIGVLGHDIAAAQVLGVVIAAASAWLLVAIVRPASSTTTALIVAAVIGTSRGFMVVNFGFLMAEGLYLAFALAAVRALAPLLGEDRRPDRAVRVTIAASAFAAGAFATRFVGLGVVLGISAAAALLLARPWHLRVRLGAMALAVGAAPVLAWNFAISRSGSTGERHLGYHPLRDGDLALTDTLAQTHLPRPVIDLLGTGAWRAIGWLLFAAALAWTIGRLVAAAQPSAATSERTCAALLLVGWGHLWVLVATRVFVDQLIPIGGRHTSLWFACVVAAMGIDVNRRARLDDAPSWVRPAVVAVCAAVLLGGVAVSGRALQDPIQSWWNLAQAPPSPLALKAAQLPDDVLVYTNREDLLYVTGSQPTALLPEPDDRYTGERDPRFESEVAAIGAAAEDGDAAIVVYTDDPNWIVPVDTLQSITGLTVVHEGPEGVILAPG